LQAGEPANEAGLLAENGAGDFRDLTPILVPKREMLQQVADRLDADCRQLRGALRSDSG
jgi:hypothetical protein